MSDMERAGSLFNSVIEKFEILMQLPNLDEGIEPKDIIHICSVISDLANMNIQKHKLDPYENADLQATILEYYAEVMYEADSLAENIKKDSDIDDDDLADYVEELQDCLDMLQLEPTPPPEEE